MKNKTKRIRITYIHPSDATYQNSKDEWIGRTGRFVFNGEWVKSFLSGWFVPDKPDYKGQDMYFHAIRYKKI